MDAKQSDARMLGKATDYIDTLYNTSSGCIHRRITVSANHSPQMRHVDGTKGNFGSTQLTE